MKAHLFGLSRRTIMVKQGRACGFTLIELIMVLVVLGALTVFVVPRFTSKSSFDSLSFHQELKTAIQFAHKLSIASGCDVQVVISANSYSLFYRDNLTCTGAFIVAVTHPTKAGGYTGTAPTGVTITPFGNFNFTTSGAPNPDATGTITVNPGAKIIVVNQLTGYVQ